MTSEHEDRGSDTDSPCTILASIILPAYNEAEALPSVLESLSRVINETYEIVVVDDGSTDRTVEFARKGNCRVICHAQNMGKGAAVRTGVANARGQRIIIMDADATYPSDAIPKMVDLLATHDVVRCHRESRHEQMPTINRLGNWVFDTLLSRLHGLEGGDHLSGLYGMRMDAIHGMGLEADGFDIEAEIGIKARAQKLDIAVFPITYSARLGEKKLRPLQDGLLILRRILLLMLVYNPMATFVAPGLILMAISVVVAMMLSRGPVITPYFGLSIHSYIVAILGILAAFQLIAFGMAAALYGTEVGYRPQRWLLMLSSRPIRLGGATIVTLVLAGATANVVRMIVKWLANGGGLFVETRALVLSSTLAVLGLQIISTMLFLSLFADRLRRSMKTATLVHGHILPLGETQH
jgi:glycosyltransferase involved in cell wall biosynthesis